MRFMSMVGDAARLKIGWKKGGRRSVLALGALLVLGACAREEPPAVHWQTTTEPPPAPLTAAPPASAPPAAAPTPIPGSRGPCLTRWGSPRLDAPPECASKGPRTSRALPGRSIYKVGRPYTIGGRTYVPAEDPAYDEVGTASWYGTGFHGGPTANGEIFDMNRLTAAHRTLPMPSYAYVQNTANGRTIMVRINNRGPFKGDRIIDLSKEAARLLAFEGQGLVEVRVTYAGRAPLDGSDHAERAFLERQPWYRQAVTLGE